MIDQESKILERNASKDKKEPSKLLPLSQISSSKREHQILTQKTPSMIDLVPQK